MLLYITYRVAVVFTFNFHRSPSLSVTGKEALYTQGVAWGWGLGMGMVRPPPHPPAAEYKERKMNLLE